MTCNILDADIPEGSVMDGLLTTVGEVIFWVAVAKWSDVRTVADLIVIYLDVIPNPMTAKEWKNQDMSKPAASSCIDLGRAIQNIMITSNPNPTKLMTNLSIIRDFRDVIIDMNRTNIVHIKNDA